MTTAAIKSVGPAPRVLVVEDERRLRELLLDVIPDMGFVTRGARSAEEALEMLRREPAEVLLLDLHLPGMSGLEMLAQLRAEGHPCQAIIMTAYGDLDAARAAIRHDVADFLTKPSPLGEIEAALDRARGRLRARGAAAAIVDEVENSSPMPLAESERQQILAALARHGGNRTTAAAELGISRRTLHYKLAAYRQDGIDID